MTPFYLINKVAPLTVLEPQRLSSKPQPRVMVILPVHLAFAGNLKLGLAILVHLSSTAIPPYSLIRVALVNQLPSQYKNARGGSDGSVRRMDTSFPAVFPPIHAVFLSARAPHHRLCRHNKSLLMVAEAAASNHRSMQSQVTAGFGLANEALTATK